MGGVQGNVVLTVKNVENEYLLALLLDDPRSFASRLDNFAYEHITSSATYPLALNDP